MCDELYNSAVATRQLHKTAANSSFSRPSSLSLPPTYLSIVFFPK